MDTKKFQHGEAFRWMYYSNYDGTIGYWIYNSRDGVTPFMCNINDVQLQHKYWNNDLQQTSYIPKKGDFVWRTMTEDEAEQNINDMYEFHKDNKDFLNHPAFLDKAKAIAEARKDARDQNHPALAIVDGAGNFVLYK